MTAWGVAEAGEPDGAHHHDCTDAQGRLGEPALAQEALEERVQGSEHRRRCGHNGNGAGMPSRRGADAKGRPCCEQRGPGATEKDGGPEAGADEGDPAPRGFAGLAGCQMGLRPFQLRRWKPPAGVARQVVEHPRALCVLRPSLDVRLEPGELEAVPRPEAQRRCSVGRRADLRGELRNGTPFDLGDPQGMTPPLRQRREGSSHQLALGDGDLGLLRRLGELAQQMGLGGQLLHAPTPVQRDVPHGGCEVRLEGAVGSATPAKGTPDTGEGLRGHVLRVEGGAGAGSDPGGDEPIAAEQLGVGIAIARTAALQQRLLVELAEFGSVSRVGCSGQPTGALRFGIHLGRWLSVPGTPCLWGRGTVATLEGAVGARQFPNG